MFFYFPLLVVFSEVELCSSCISFDGFLVLFIVSFSNSIGISLGIYFARRFFDESFFLQKIMLLLVGLYNLLLLHHSFQRK